MADKGDNRATTTNKQDADAPTPDSARTNGELDGSSVREPSVGVAEKLSFNERTAVGQPFILEDGTQDNGARDLEQQDGARGQSVREGNNSVREDTRTAIKNGDLPASDQPKGTLKGEESKEDKVRNPVK